jgi:hypothetical protein
MALVFYSLTDILVWQRIFETNQLVEYADEYHLGWSVSLAGYAAVGVVILADHWKDCIFYLATLFVGAFSGLEDVLYYLLDGRPVPTALPWLEANPLIFDSSRAGVIGSVIFWLLVLTLVYAIMFRSRGAPNAAGLRKVWDANLNAAPRQDAVSSKRVQAKDSDFGEPDRPRFASSSSDKSSA